MRLRLRLWAAEAPGLEAALGLARSDAVLAVNQVAWLP
jgi:hypothetical protein